MPAAALTLTSSPKDIYAHVSSLKELRHHTAVFEAALAQQKGSGVRDTDDKKDDDHGEKHSTCFKLYQAVRSLKKRDNKKEEKERLYSTLEDAFDAHRHKVLSGATATHRRRTSSLQHADVPAASTTVSTSCPSSSTAPVEAAVDLVPVGVSGAPSSDADGHEVRVGGLAIQPNELHQPHSTAHPMQRSTQRSTQEPQRCLSSPLLGEMKEMCSLLRQLSDSTGRMQSHLTTLEEQSKSLRTQLKSCHELLNVWVLKVGEARVTDCAQPDSCSILPPRLSASAACAALCGASSSAGDAPSASSSTPMRAVHPLEREKAVEVEDHEDRPPSTAVSSPRAGHGACVRETDAQMAAQSDDGGDGVDEALNSDGAADAESDRDAWPTSSRKRSRSASENGGDDSSRKQLRASSSDGSHADGVTAEVAADNGDPERRCVWVQSQREMSKHDLTMIFSHFGHLERVDVPRPHSGRVPFAFVHFQEEEDAKSTIRRASDGEFGSLTVKPYQCRRDAWQPVQRSNDRWTRGQ